VTRWRLVQAIGAVAVVVAAAWQWHARAGALQAPDRIAIPWMLLAVAAQAGVSLGNTRLAHTHLRLHGHAVPWSGLLRINLWGSLLNLVLPLGLGLLLRGAWLHTRQRVPLVQAGQHLMETNLLVFAVNLWLLVLLLAVGHPMRLAWPALAVAAVAAAFLPHARPLIARAALIYPCVVLINVAVAQGLALRLPWEFLFILPLLLHASALVVLAPGALAVTESLFMLAAVIFEAPIADALWLALGARATGLVAVATLLLGLHLEGLREGVRSRRS